MGLISFLMHYCIVMQAIWCLKFWNMTKSGGQFALPFPTPNSEGTRPPAPVIYAQWVVGKECKRKGVTDDEGSDFDLHVEDDWRCTRWGESEVESLRWSWSNESRRELFSQKRFCTSKEPFQWAVTCQLSRGCCRWSINNAARNWTEIRSLCRYEGWMGYQEYFVCEWQEILAKRMQDEDLGRRFTSREFTLRGNFSISVMGISGIRVIWTTDWQTYANFLAEVIPIIVTLG